MLPLFFPLIFAALSAVGSGIQGLQQARAFSQQAANRRLEGEAEAADQAREGRAAIGFGQVAIGASGLTGEGSARDALVFIEQQNSAAVRRARYGANRDSDILRARARQARIGAITSFAGAGVNTGLAAHKVIHSGTIGSSSGGGGSGAN